MTDHCPACAARREKVESVSAKTDFSYNTVNWIAGAINFLAVYKSKGIDSSHVDAREFCRMLIADIRTRDHDAIATTLQAMKIASSRDIGRIVYAMIDEGLCIANQGDSESDFADVFDSAAIGDYVHRSGLSDERDWPIMVKNAIMWAFYIFGSALSIIVFEQKIGRSWFWLGPTLLGVGWLVAKPNFPKRARFGLPWATLELRSQNNSHLSF